MGIVDRPLEASTLLEWYPQLNTLFNEATKLARAGGTKPSWDVAVADQAPAEIDETRDLLGEQNGRMRRWGQRVITMGNA
jgi:hypothetical protein